MWQRTGGVCEPLPLARASLVRNAHPTAGQTLGEVCRQAKAIRLLARALSRNLNSGSRGSRRARTSPASCDGRDLRSCLQREVQQMTDSGLETACPAHLQVMRARSAARRDSFLKWVQLSRRPLADA